MRKRMISKIFAGGIAAAVMMGSMELPAIHAIDYMDPGKVHSESQVIEELLSQDDSVDPASYQEMKAIVSGCEEYGLRSEAGSDSVIVTLYSGHQVVIRSVIVVEDRTVWYEVDTNVSGVSYHGYIEAAYLLSLDMDKLVNLPLEDRVPAVATEPSPDGEQEPGKEEISEDPDAVNISDQVESDQGYQMDAEISQLVSGDFESSIAGFPEDYKVRLRALHESHPNWVFVPQMTHVDWNTFINAEMTPSRALIERSVDDSYKGKQSWAYNSETGEYIGLSGYNWVQASQEAVEYFADPRNFIKEKDIFQFELLTYNGEYQSENGVEAIVNGTFMSHTVMPGDSRTYAQAFCQIGSEVNVSPYMLAARVRQEQGGGGTSPLISGSYPGYEGLYNYFNIHAYGSTEEEIYTNGLSYAREQGWTSRYSSIAGGAGVLSGNYISKGQDTLYLQKFDVDDSYYGLFSHQYMQNIRGAYNEGRTAYNAYSNIGILDNTFVFKIPVYDNMPLTACPMPENASRKKEVEGFVSRLYVNILGREADAAGMEHWCQCLTSGGETAAAVTTRFVFSTEFKNQNVSDDEFVERMYMTMLNRGSDPSGKEHWLDLLDAGCSRRYILSRFVASKEFTNICDSYDIIKGSVPVTEARDQHLETTRFVTRLYRMTLKRRPDVDGLNHWVSLISNKSASPYEVAERIVKSQEFKLHNYSDEEYVTILYRAFLNREPEAEGLQHWLNKLASGSTREDILRGFAYSKEFQILAKSYGL